MEEDNEYWVCGNASGAGKCHNIEANYSCLPGLGNNPKMGYVNYDDFPWSLLSLFQLITLDFWEYQYNLVSGKAFREFESGSACCQKHGCGIG